MSAPPIAGFIDSITRERVYGWVWDQREPERRLEVEVHHRNRLLGTTRAELPRPDLRMNGVGDGKYAFEFPLEGIGEEIDPLHLQVLVRPDPDGEPVEVPKSANALNPELLDTGRALFRLIELFEILHTNQVELTRRVPATVAELRGAVRHDVQSALVPRLDGLSEASGTGLSAIEKRLSDLEVFVTRLDTTLRAIDRKIDATAGNRGDPVLRAMVGVLLAVVMAAILGAVLHFG